MRPWEPRVILNFHPMYPFKQSLFSLTSYPDVNKWISLQLDIFMVSGHRLEIFEKLTNSVFWGDIDEVKLEITRFGCFRLQLHRLLTFNSRDSQ